MLIDLAALALFAAVFIPLERLLPIVHGRRFLRPYLGLDLMHVVCSGVAIRIGIVLVIAGTVFAAAVVIPDSLGTAVRMQPLWLQFVEVLLLADFVFYWVHRAFHQVPALWRIHSVHHSIEELDWIAAHRVHPIDQILTKGLSVAPVFALGFNLEAVAAFTLVYAWQSLLIHSNANVRFGPLRFFLVSPQFHHWHHANEAEARDKNFSAQLPVWDYLFGTAYVPGSAMPCRYGTDEQVPMTYVGQLLHAFPTLARKRGLLGSDASARRVTLSKRVL